MVHLLLAVIFSYVMPKEMNLRRKRKYSFAVVVIPIINRFVMGRIRKLDLKVIQFFRANKRGANLKKLMVIVFFFLFLGSMSACSKNQTTDTTSSDTNAIVITGDDVFQKSCISCHSSGDLPGGNIKLDSAKIHNDFKNEEDLTNFVQTNMPKNSPGSLSKKESEAVAKYLWNQKQ